MKTAGKTSATERKALRAQALDTFGDKHKMRRWFNKHNVGLGGKTPARLSRTTAGAALVRTSLGRIEYGIFA